MDLFGLNRFFNATEDSRPPKKGPGRYFEVLYDHLGAILGANLLTCAGFLPLALGVSLGIVLENLWLSLAGGALGGAVAGPFWAALNAVALQCFRGGCDGWFGRWRGVMARFLGPAAAQGAALGLLGAGLLAAGAFFSTLLGSAQQPALFVWIVILADLYLLALAAALLFPSLTLSGEGLGARLKGALSMVPLAPARVLAAAAALLAWGALLVGLVPASVPLSLALGFWPPALLSAQLLLPALCTAFDTEDGPWAAVPSGGGRHSAGTVIGASPQRPVRQSADCLPNDCPGGLTTAQRTEIWWRRRWPLVVGLVVCLSLFAGVLSTLLNREEPDLQIAVVHAETLPDGVLSALEDALSNQVGDLNGDGRAWVMVNDYPVVFDGSAKDTDIQTAGMARLVTDVAAGDSALFAVADVDGFLANYADKVDGDAAALWGECPALAGLDAGVFSTAEDIYTDVDGQTLLTGLTVLPARSAREAALALLG